MSCVTNQGEVKKENSMNEIKYETCEIFISTFFDSSISREYEWIEKYYVL